MMSRKKILLILTGGTISMDTERNLSSDILHLQKERLQLLENKMLDDIEFDTFVFAMKPSPHITPDDMLTLAEFIDDQVMKDIYQGFVITHGTDTLEETAFFIDLYFSEYPLRFPIVFTGSMRNYSDIAYDGLNNIVSALLVASHVEAKKHGVLVVLNDIINTAREVTKSHTVSLDTFKSLNFGPIGIIDDYQILFYRQISPAFNFSKIKRIDKKVYIYKTFSGDDGSLLLALKDYDAVILEGFGRGNVPPLIVPVIQKLIENNVIVVISTRVPAGRVFGTYPYNGGGGQLVKIGCFLTPDLNSQKARILLLYALSAGMDIKTLLT